ncbi:hypothetical protein [Gracilimonas halophila]|uniref:hypothetical protein n=1 Tax=Gracilimonas halophila TaxID=1834464 RepID=UPI0036F2F2AB
MKEFIKYSLSTILLVLSVVLFYNYNFGEPDLSADQQIGMSYATHVNIDDSDFEHIFWEIDKVSANKIYPVIILTTAACYLCLNNVVEFSELLKNDTTFAEPILVFFEENDIEVNKFIRLTELDIPYKNLTNSNLNGHFTNEKQNLIFVDKRDNLIFYNFPIPNSIMLPERKIRIIQQAREAWR